MMQSFDIHQFLEKADEIDTKEALQQCAELLQATWQANNDAQEQLENQRQQYDTKIEALEHEKYQLILDKEKLQKLYSNNYDEISNENVELNKKVQQIQKNFDAQRKRINLLEAEKNCEREQNKEEKERYQLKYNEIVCKCTDYEKKMNELQEQLRAAHLKNENNSELDKGQLQQLYDSLVVTSAQLQETEQAYMELQTLNENLNSEIGRINLKTSHLESQLQEKDEELESLMESLQNTRDALQQVKLQSGSLGQELKKDKSIFNEVEDRRLDMREEYSKLKNQYDSLMLAHDGLKRQWHRLRNQVSNLIQAGSRKADSNKVSYLECALSQKESEISKLKKRIQVLENDSIVGIEETHNFPKQSMDNDKYSSFLALKCKRLQSELLEMTKELHNTQLMVISEATKLKQANAKIYRTESDCEKANQEVMKLKLKMSEMNTTIANTKSVPSLEKLDKKFKNSIEQNRKPFRQINNN